MICVATDPDADPASLLMPASPGPGGMKNPDGKGPKLPDLPPPPAKDGKPPVIDQKGAPKSGETPIATRPPPKGFNPLTAKLSDEEKELLREIHVKYGTFGKSPLGHAVIPGEQTFDLELKK